MMVVTATSVADLRPSKAPEGLPPSAAVRLDLRHTLQTSPLVICQLDRRLGNVDLNPPRRAGCSRTIGCCKRPHNSVRRIQSSPAVAVSI